MKRIAEMMDVILNNPDHRYNDDIWIDLNKSLETLEDCDNLEKSVAHFMNFYIRDLVNEMDDINGKLEHHAAAMKFFAEQEDFSAGLIYFRNHRALYDQLKLKLHFRKSALRNMAEQVLL